MARKSPRSNWIVALTLVVVASVSISAHRRDEYLQAARLAIDPDRVQIELDLTPGIMVAARVLADLDLDRNGVLSESEAHAYASELLRAIALDVDGTPLTLQMTGVTTPDVAAVLNGVGTMRMYAAAALPRLAESIHHLRYRNSYRPDVGVYLANALVPVSERILVKRQRRDVDQRELTVEYMLRPDRLTRARSGLSVAIAGALLLAATIWRVRPCVLEKGRD